MSENPYSPGDQPVAWEHFRQGRFGQAAAIAEFESDQAAASRPAARAQRIAPDESAIAATQQLIALHPEMSASQLAQASARIASVRTSAEVASMAADLTEDWQAAKDEAAQAADDLAARITANAASPTSREEREAALPKRTGIESIYTRD